MDSRHGNELHTIINALQQFTEGATLLQLLAALSIEMSQRTLTRRLQSLVASGQVTTSGNTRSLRYHADKKTETTPEPVREYAIEEDNHQINLTPAAKKILKVLSEPVEQRKPVGYHKDFLEKYEPNITPYLSTEQSKQLAQLGKIPGPVYHQAGTYTKDLYNRLLIDLSWNSSRLEGNTYSLLDND
jgi:hypothetical protein